MDKSENTAALIHAVRGEWAERAHVNATTYKDMYKFSVSDPDGFWECHGKRVDWIKPFTRVKNTCFDPGTVSDMPEITVAQIQHFFEPYKDLEPGKWVKMVGWGGRAEARQPIVDAITRAKKL